ASVADFAPLQSTARPASGDARHWIGHAPCTSLQRQTEETAMVEFNHILVPTDFGEAANRAIEVALDLAAKYKAKVTLVHAFAVPALAYAETFELPVASMIASADDALSKSLARARERYDDVSAALVQGEPWEEILSAAKNQQADMIIMGTHGRRG